MVSLVQNYFLGPFRIHSLALRLARPGGDLFTRRTPRLSYRLGVARVRRPQIHRHHRSAAEIHGLLHLMRQVRPSILHLGDARVRIVRVLPLLI